MFVLFVFKSVFSTCLSFEVPNWKILGPDSPVSFFRGSFWEDTVVSVSFSERILHVYECLGGDCATTGGELHAPRDFD